MAEYHRAVPDVEAEICLMLNSEEIINYYTGLGISTKILQLYTEKVKEEAKQETIKSLLGVHFICECGRIEMLNEYADVNVVCGVPDSMRCFNCERMVCDNCWTWLECCEDAVCKDCKSMVVINCTRCYKECCRKCWQLCTQCRNKMCTSCSKSKYKCGAPNCETRANVEEFGIFYF